MKLSNNKPNNEFSTVVDELLISVYYARYAGKSLSHYFHSADGSSTS